MSRLKCFLKRLVWRSERGFEQRLAAYLEAGPGVLFKGKTYYVWLDSASVIRSLGGAAYGLGFYLRESRPGTIDFYSLLAAKPRGFTSSRNTTMEPKYTSGFSTRFSFEDARDLFEESIRSLLRLGESRLAD